MGVHRHGLEPQHSDISRLGAMLHQMLSGNDPSETPFRFAPLPSSLPGALEALVMHMVEMNEGKRAASTDAVRQELELIAGLLGIPQQGLSEGTTRSAPPFQAGQSAPAATTPRGIAVAPSGTGAPLATIPALVVQHHTTYPGHRGWVWGAAWSPDGR